MGTVLFDRRIIFKFKGNLLERRLHMKKIFQMMKLLIIYTILELLQEDDS